MPITGLSQNQVLQLGMLALKRCPELCIQILEELEEPEPSDTNLENIGKYFSVYCDRLGTTEDDLRPNLWSRDRNYKFKVFAGAMVRIYRPFIITYHGHKLKPGFNIKLAKTLNLYQPNISKMVREVQILEKAYDDFKYEVDYTEHYLSLAREKF